MRKGARAYLKLAVMMGFAEELNAVVDPFAAGFGGTCARRDQELAGLREALRSGSHAGIRCLFARH